MVEQNSWKSQNAPLKLNLVIQHVLVYNIVYNLCVSPMYIIRFFFTSCVKIAKYTKLLRKVILHDEDDDGIERLPELYYVPYDKVCLILAEATIAYHD